jgi:hypothetical protein
VLCADDDQILGLDVSKHGERAAAFDLDVYAGSVHGAGWGSVTEAAKSNGVHGTTTPDVA